MEIKYNVFSSLEMMKDHFRRFSRVESRFYYFPMEEIEINSKIDIFCL